MEVTFLVILIMLVWFNTDAFVEYIRLFKLGNYFHVNEYFDIIRAPEVQYTYIDFLKEYFDSFFVRLISCPICLSVWLAWLATCITGIGLFPIVAVLGLSGYAIISKLL